MNYGAIFRRLGSDDILRWIVAPTPIPDLRRILQPPFEVVGEVLSKAS
jgi:hypothetical protein